MRALATAIRDRRSLLIGLAAAVVMWLLVGFLAQYTMVLPLLTWDALPLSSKAWLLVQMGMLWPLTLDPLMSAIVVVTILITGANASLLAYLWHTRAQALRSGGASAGAVILSLLGVGCVSCGTITLSFILGSTAATALIGFLPLAGREFSLLALLLNLFVSVHIAREVTQGHSCPNRTSAKA